MTIVYMVSENLKKKMIDFYADRKKEKTPPYAVFQAADYDVVVTMYESGKVMFQGIGADIEASIWIEQERILNNRIINIDEKGKDKKDSKDKKEDTVTYYHLNTIGSDEVGTGDYFGPIVVCASYVAKKDHTILENLGVKDSKKLTDDKIISIAKEIIKFIPHVIYVLDNSSYNASYSENFNMNKIKAILHNKALLSLIKKDSYDYDKIIVDQFVYPKKYYEHLQGANEKVTNITFVTKAEEKSYSVACASIIARYRFLIEMDNLSKTLGMILPKGAGEVVDKAGADIVKKYGEKKLTEIAKVNFKNTNKIKESLN